METIKLSVELSISPIDLYNDWLTSESHAAFTGGDALIQPVIESTYSAWDDYISGKILALDEGKRILMTWRTLEFDQDSEDSILELLFEKTEIGCKMILNHTNLAKGDGEKYSLGWQEHYFTPMKKYYS